MVCDVFQIAISISGPTCSVSTGMHVQVLYANIGALVNPQRKILGVKFTYEDPQSITFKVGVKEKVLNQQFRFLVEFYLPYVCDLLRAQVAGNSF